MLLDPLTELTSSPLTYGVIVAFVALDAVFPLVPGETLVTTGAVLALDGELLLPLIVLAGILGGVIGDSASYLLGSRVGRPASERLFRDEKSRRRLEWARRQLDARGAVIIVAARFIPGGRTATTFSAGTLDYGWRRFLPIDLVAVTLWACYATGIGVIGGEAFTDSLWKPLAIAAAIAAAVTVTGELLRRRAGDA